MFQISDLTVQELESLLNRFYCEMEEIQSGFRGLRDSFVRMEQFTERLTKEIDGKKRSATHLSQQLDHLLNDIVVMKQCMERRYDVEQTDILLDPHPQENEGEPINHGQ